MVDSLTYAADAVPFPALLPLLLPSYFPDTCRVWKVTHTLNTPKSYISYTSRIVKEKSRFGINRQALDYINEIQSCFQTLVCSAVVHLMCDTKKVTVQEQHIRTTARVLLTDPLLSLAERRLDMLAGLKSLSDNIMPRRTALVEQYGLIFPPSRFRDTLLRINAEIKWRVSVASSVATATIVQVFTEFLVDHVISACQETQKRRITVDHVGTGVINAGMGRFDTRSRDKPRDP